MSSVLTLARKELFPTPLDEITTKENIEIEGELTEAETRIFSLTEDKTLGYSRYEIKHYQKYSIHGKLGDKEFNQILRMIDITLYTKSDNLYSISISKEKGAIIDIALNRLSQNEKIKLTPVELNLIDIIPVIINKSPSVMISAGWFKEIGLPNLSNALLKGKFVDKSEEWEKFRTRIGAGTTTKLSFIELYITIGGKRVCVSLSRRGYIFIKNEIGHSQCLEVADKIINLINESSKN